MPPASIGKEGETPALGREGELGQGFWEGMTRACVPTGRLAVPGGALPNAFGGLFPSPRRSSSHSTRAEGPILQMGKLRLERLLKATQGGWRLGSRPAQGQSQKTTFGNRRGIYCPALESHLAVDGPSSQPPRTGPVSMWQANGSKIHIARLHNPQECQMASCSCANARERLTGNARCERAERARETFQGRVGGTGFKTEKQARSLT